MGFPVSKRQRVGQSHAHAPKQERALAKRLYGETQPGSGAKHRKGDVLTEFAVVECKCTSKKSFSVDRKMLTKIEEAAMSQRGRAPVIQIEFLDDQGKLLNTVFVMSEQSAMQLLEKRNG